MIRIASAPRDGPGAGMASVFDFFRHYQGIGVLEMTVRACFELATVSVQFY